MMHTDSGWYSTMSDHSVYLTVTEPTDNAIKLSVPKTEIMTLENVPYSVVAPGAYMVGVYWNDTMSVQCAQGDHGSNQFVEFESGTYTLHACAKYSEDGEWITGDTAVTIHVTAPYGPLSLDMSDMPESFAPGEDVALGLAAADLSADG